MASWNAAVTITDSLCCSANNLVAKFRRSCARIDRSAMPGLEEPLSCFHVVRSFVEDQAN